MPLLQPNGKEARGHRHQAKSKLILRVLKINLIYNFNPLSQYLCQSASPHPEASLGVAPPPPAGGRSFNSGKLFIFWIELWE